ADAAGGGRQPAVAGPPGEPAGGADRPLGGNTGGRRRFMGEPEQESPMSDLDRREAEQRLWDAIDDTRIGMLGLHEPGQHMQPMTAFCEPETNSIWFFTRRTTDLARDAAGGREAMFCLISKDRKLYACVGGRLQPSHDPERIERHWNPVVASWFSDGKDDPELTLLRLDADDAQIWLNEAGPIRFAWEVARGNLTDHQPDMGERAHVNFQ